VATGRRESKNGSEGGGGCGIQDGQKAETEILVLHIPVLKFLHVGSGTLLIYVKYQGLSSVQVWPYRCIYGDGILSSGITKDGNPGLRLKRRPI
jgi:hypothetical protein